MKYVHNYVWWLIICLLLKIFNALIALNIVNSVLYVSMRCMCKRTCPVFDLETASSSSLTI